MINQTKKIITLSIVALASSIPSFAAEMDKVKITVPFAFRAGSANLPAGQYVVARENPSGLLLIKGSGGAAMVITHPGSLTAESHTSSLEFRKNVNGAILQEVRFSGESTDVLPLIRK